MRRTEGFYKAELAESKPKLGIREFPENMVKWIKSDVNQNNYLGLLSLFSRNYDWKELAKDNDFQQSIFETITWLDDKLIKHDSYRANEGERGSSEGVENVILRDDEIETINELLDKLTKIVGAFPYSRARA